MERFELETLIGRLEGKAQAEQGNFLSAIDVQDYYRLVALVHTRYGSREKIKDPAMRDAINHIEAAFQENKLL